MVKAFTLASLLATILLVKAATIPNHERTSSNGMKLNITKPQALAPPSADCLTESWAPLSRKKSGKPYSKAMMAMHMVNGDVPTALLDSSDGVEYLVPVFWNDQEFQAVLDTGSSDTWLISHNFTCINYAGREVEQALCAFGPGYSGTFTENPDLDFYISYGSGEYVIGNIGTVPMGIAGITVPEQTVALGTEAYWRGLGVASGLVGLAYPSLTGAVNATNRFQQYDPFFTNAWKLNLTAPTFALALMRGESGGYISFGGLPPVGSASDTFGRTDIEMLSGIEGLEELAFYTITPDAIVYPGSSQTEQPKYIVDSGTNLNCIFPSSIAKGINEAFNPPATLDPDYNAWLVDCNAMPPHFGVTIGGITLYADPRDMILGADQLESLIDGKCISGVQDSGSAGVSILGDVWLRSVIAVFDVGASELRFAAHSY